MCECVIRLFIAVLHALPKLPLGWALSHHKQEAGSINAVPWNAIRYLRSLCTDIQIYACTVPNNAQSCPYLIRLKHDAIRTSVTPEVLLPSAYSKG